MNRTYIIPLSPVARFMATQLACAGADPCIVLPQKMREVFLKSQSSITYINRISRDNLFQRRHTFPSVSVDRLVSVCRPAEAVMERTYGSTNESERVVLRMNARLSLVVPASHVKTILNPNTSECPFIPPPDSDVIILNPHFGQVEGYVRAIRELYMDGEREPRIWSAICTHRVTNAPFWGVEHRSIGELKIARVPFTVVDGGDDYQDIANVGHDEIVQSELVKNILSIPMMLPQMQSYRQQVMLTAEQTVVEAALSLATIEEYADGLAIGHLKVEDMVDFTEMAEIAHLEGSSGSDSAARSMVLDIVTEATRVLKRHRLVKQISVNSPVVNAVLSKERLYNLSLNIVNDHTLLTKLNYSFDSFRHFEGELKDAYGCADTGGDTGGDVRSPPHAIHANRYICELGSLFGIPTPANRKVCDLYEAAVAQSASTP